MSRSFIPRAAAILTAGAIALGLSACGAASPIRTAELYSGGDGVLVQVGADAKVRVENLMVLTDGKRAQLFGVVANDTDAAVEVAISYEGHTEKVAVQAKGWVRLDTTVAATAPLKTPAGANVETKVACNGVTTAQVPVLDGTAEPYKSLWK